ncbi:putative Membrane protein [Candidatus Terasakiella magnetica]|uniref:Putative Membrane protein n=1 Tax=Candidatus Terasakiella magnetica TaxID=1867952 RepID=A0A1C3RD91_9PROT|nr:YeeE/YedE thiosulfate transporter family protein [Candidatus Terasakiella magnetica]SCA55246.1 putative Membrane protein [Candidatus Terasakiella magnetica]
MEKVLLAIVIGGAFGFVLDRIGATNPNVIIHMLRLSKLHLMKTILLAIGFSSVLMFTGFLVGIIDVGHMSVKTAYIGVFVGGVLLGLGFAAAGYCPGTGLAAAATGRKDALFFVLGGLVGAGAYMATYSQVKATGLLDKVLGGKVTLGAVDGAKYSSVFETMPGEVIGIILGVAFMVIAFVLPDSFRKEA